MWKHSVRILDTVDPDLIILQNLTFANAAYASEIMHRFRNVPLLLWTLREPVIDGGRLRLNALTGASQRPIRSVSSKQNRLNLSMDHRKNNRSVRKRKR